MAQLAECPALRREVSHLDKALEFVHRFRTAVDVGAHRGLWTTKLVDHFDEVHAFEPRPLMAKQITTEARVHCEALGARLGECAMREGRDNDGQAYIAEGEGTPVTMLDVYYLEHVDFIKIDAEGYELFVLQGAMRTLVESEPVIVLEKNGLSKRYGYEDDDIDYCLATIGYECRARWNKNYLYTT